MITAVTVAYAALFVAAAVTDVLTLRIPNAIVLALLALFAVVCIVAPPKALLWHHVVPALVVFALGAVLFYFDKFGGGDVKLLTVAVLWIGFGALGPFLISLSLYGMIAILIFAVFRTQAVMLIGWTAAQIGRPIPTPPSLLTGKSIPYGVVIAAAALTTGIKFLGR